MQNLLEKVRDFLCLIFLPSSKQQKTYDEAFYNGQSSQSDKLPPPILYDPRPYTLGAQPTQPQQNEVQKVNPYKLQLDTPPQQQAPHSQLHAQYGARLQAIKKMDAHIKQSIMEVKPTNILPDCPKDVQAFFQHAQTSEPVEPVVEDMSWLNDRPIEMPVVQIAEEDEAKTETGIPSLMQLRHGK